MNKVLKTSQKFICISRPRRFGKSMAANMLAAYYGRECASKELFEAYKITKRDSYEENLNQYNVIFINVQNACSRAKSVENKATLTHRLKPEGLR